MVGGGSEESSATGVSACSVDEEGTSGTAGGDGGEEVVESSVDSIGGSGTSGGGLAS